MIGTIGQLGLIAAFVACLVGTWAFYRATIETDAPGWLRAARWSWGAVTLGVGLASALLMGLLVTHQFQYAYVYQYSSRDLPIGYLVSTFWAGQEGSFLLWILYTAFLGWAVMRWSPASWRAPVMAVVALCQAFLLSMIVGLKLGPLSVGSPMFATLAERFPEAPMLQVPGFVPQDGNGLNDLLQNPWMTIHPPTLFVGFATMLAPFAFAVAGLWTRRYREWVKPAMPWLLMGTLILGIGIALGGYWAYVTLSFGGYWAWDPVENSSLVPWIVGVSGLHAMLVTKKRAGFRSAFALTIAAFILVVYSTFLTRSGILGDVSVHSFVDLGLSGQLVIWIGVMTALGVGLLAWRWKEIPRPDAEAPTLSREFMTFSGAVLLTALGAVILLGTSAPIFGRIFRDEPSGVPITFYNEWSLPLATGIMLLVALGMVFWWHRMRVEQIQRAVMRPLALAVASTLALIVLTPFAARTARPGAGASAGPMEAGLASGLGDFWAQHGGGLLLLLLVLASFFALYGNLGVAWRIGRGNPKMAGGALAHVGLALTMLGIVASGAFSRALTAQNGVDLPVVGGTSRDNFVLARGETKTLGAYTVRYTGREKTGAGHDRYVLDVQHGTRAFTLNPVVYQSEKGQWIQHPDVASFVEQDLYAAVTPAAMFEAPEDTARKGGSFALAPGDTLTLGNDAYRVRFAGYRPEPPAQALQGLSRDSIEVAIAADVALTNLRTGETRPLQPVYLVMKDGRQSFVQTRLPDWGVALAFGGLDVETGKATFVVDGVAVTPDDWIVVQAYEKPFIGVLWLGITLLSLGFVVAFVRRIGDVARTPLAEG
jgi:cytochrome c-type biogenesis protein CcmF